MDGEDRETKSRKGRNRKGQNIIPTDRKLYRPVVSDGTANVWKPVAERLESASCQGGTYRNSSFNSSHKLIGRFPR